MGVKVPSGVVVVLVEVDGSPSEIGGPYPEVHEGKVEEDLSCLGPEGPDAGVREDN